MIVSLKLFVQITDLGAVALLSIQVAQLVDQKVLC